MNGSRRKHSASPARIRRQSAAAGRRRDFVRSRFGVKLPLLAAEPRLAKDRRVLRRSVRAPVKPPFDDRLDHSIHGPRPGRERRAAYRPACEAWFWSPHPAGVLHRQGKVLFLFVIFVLSVVNQGF
jgi:hypothetical protein